MAGRNSAADFTVALIGNPNVGKSTLFNRLTGLRQHTGNWSGKTVEQAEGFYPYKGKRYRLVDLPGTYSLRSRSRDEAITATYLRQQTPDCVLVICDGTCLERNLILVQQLLGLTTRLVVAVNLLDEAARRGIALDLPLLQRQLGAPVAGISAGHGTGLPQLQELVRQVCQGYLASPGDGDAAADARQEARRAGQIARMTVRQTATPQASRFDRLLMRRGFGAAFLLFLLLGLLWLTIAGANYPTAALQAGFDALGRCLERWLQGLPPFFFGLLTQGLYATAARVIAVMLPPMAIFFSSLHAVGGRRSAAPGRLFAGPSLRPLRRGGPDGAADVHGPGLQRRRDHRLPHSEPRPRPDSSHPHKCAHPLQRALPSADPAGRNAAGCIRAGLCLSAGHCFAAGPGPVRRGNAAAVPLHHSPHRQRTQQLFAGAAALSQAPDRAGAGPGSVGPDAASPGPGRLHCRSGWLRDLAPGPLHPVRRRNAAAGSSGISGDAGPSFGPQRSHFAGVFPIAPSQ